MEGTEKTRPVQNSSEHIMIQQNEARVIRSQCRAEHTWTEQIIYKRRGEGEHLLEGLYLM